MLDLNKSYLMNLLKNKKTMCKKCEMRDIRMSLRYLKIPSMEEMKQELAIENSWRKLFETGWNEEDLISRAYAHLKWTERESRETNRPHFLQNAKGFLNAMAKGFREPFNKSAFMPNENDPYFELKTKSLDGLEKSSITFGHRMSSVVWDSYAYLGTRDEPETSRSILKEAEQLPHHYGVCDTVFHAIPKCYKAMLVIQSDFWQSTGYVLDHNCDCSCSLINLLAGKGPSSVVFEMEEQWLYEATQSVFSHLLAESHLILNCHLPFEYSVTQEAALLPGIVVE
jgi:hypothetical protein